MQVKTGKLLKEVKSVGRCNWDTVESERMKNCDNKLSASKKLRQNATSEQNKSNKFSMHLKKTDPKLKTIKSPRELSP